MDRTALETSSREWLNQSLKQEPTYCNQRIRNGNQAAAATAAASSYFSHFDGNNQGLTDPRDYTFQIPRLNHLSLAGCPPHNFPHAFVPTGVGSSLTRTHAMHSLFETYTIESVGVDRMQYSTSVRMDQILPDDNSRKRMQRSTPSPTQMEEGGDGDDVGDEKEEGDMGGEGGIGDANNASRASYMCRKCKAHGQAVPVKRHKRACPFLQCRCFKCRLVDQGRKVVARQIALYRDQKGHSNGDRQLRLPRDPSSDTRPRVGGATRPNPTSIFQIPLSSSNDRIPMLPLLSAISKGDHALTMPAAAGPHCRRCRNHHTAVTWKGHKKSCPYRNCPCDPCRLINVRKDTEKTLRDMAGIEEKSNVPTTDEPNVNNFFTYLPTTLPLPRPGIENVNIQQQQQHQLELADDQSNGEDISVCYLPSATTNSITTSRPRFDGTELCCNLPSVQRRTRSLQNVNNPTLSQDESIKQMNLCQGEDNTSTQSTPIDHSGNLSINTTRPPSSSPVENATGFEQNSESNNGQFNQRSYDNVYYDAHDPRKHEEKLRSSAMLPFWQSFGHFEAEKNNTAPGYLGYYSGISHPLEGIHNGRVFHTNPGNHMYSPERVSAVAAAAAAAAAMVAMTPPINRSPYQQSCYGQARDGFYHHQFPPEHGYSPSGGESMDFGGGPGNGFREWCEERTGPPPRFPPRPSEHNSEYWGPSYGWGAYRYPYMMREFPLPSNPDETLELEGDGYNRPQKMLESVKDAKEVMEEVYNRPLAHSGNTTQQDFCVWRSQLHQLSISHLGVGSAEIEVRNHQNPLLPICMPKKECTERMRMDKIKVDHSNLTLSDSNGQSMIIKPDQSITQSDEHLSNPQTIGSDEKPVRFFNSDSEFNQRGSDSVAEITDSRHVAMFPATESETAAFFPHLHHSFIDVEEAASRRKSFHLSPSSVSSPLPPTFPPLHHQHSHSHHQHPTLTPSAIDTES